MSEQASFVRNESRSGELLLYLMRRWLLLAPSRTTVMRSAAAIMELMESSKILLTRGDV